MGVDRANDVAPTVQIEQHPTGRRPWCHHPFRRHPGCIDLLTRDVWRHGELCREHIEALAPVSDGGIFRDRS